MVVEAPGFAAAPVGQTVPMPSRDQQRELESLLDALAYELTGARTAGTGQPEVLRAALRKARDLLADADALAASIGAERLRD
jgi:hypothetical protein